MDSGKNLEYLYSLTRFGIKTGLDNISRLCRASGDPQDSYPVIHIAGTNGKGSTASMLQSILIEAGYKCGLYTSPHLVRFGERIRIGSQLISDDEASSMVDELRPIFEQTESTFFESATAIAFLYFARQAVDVAVIETGLGGSLDATNIVHPALSVFTPISFDHTERLGNKLSAIAADKAGIIKPGSPAVSSRQEEEALEQLKKRAVSLGCELHYAPEVALIVGGKSDYRGSEVSLRCPSRPEFGGSFELRLPGRHQWMNAQNVLTAAIVLNSRGFTLFPDVVKRGIENFRWDGRLQIISEEPLIYYDVAHNPAAAEVVAQFFDEEFPGKPVRVILGIVQEKDIKGVLEKLALVARDFIFVELNNPRSMPPEKTADIARTLNLKFSVIENPGEAIRKVVSDTGKEEIILITGSHYLGEDILHKNLT